MSDYGIIYGLDGAKLSPQQSIDRLYRAGFTDVQALCVGYAVMMGESGGYLKAWHNNVERNDDGSIALDADGMMTVKSTDLGFIQRNVKPASSTKLPPTVEAVRAYIDSLFTAYPDLARGDTSCRVAKTLYDQRGWAPWYAFLNGSYKRHLPEAAAAVQKYLAATFLNASWR